MDDKESGREDALFVELASRVRANEAEISSLHHRAEHADDEVVDVRRGVERDRHRIAALEGRADKADQRAEEADAGADRSDLRAEADRDRIWALEGRANVDALLIAELHDEGIVNREKVANLEVALRTSRAIGAAIGILMARHGVVEAEAFAMLKGCSQETNRKLRAVADDVLFIGDLPPETG